MRVYPWADAAQVSGAILWSAPEAVAAKGMYMNLHLKLPLFDMGALADISSGCICAPLCLTLDPGTSDSHWPARSQ